MNKKENSKKHSEKLWYLSFAAAILFTGLNLLLKDITPPSSWVTAAFLFAFAFLLIRKVK